MRIALLFASLCFSSAALAADKLPLKRGIFVETSVKCSERSNGTVVSFWGDELNTAQAVGKIRKVAKKGKIYTVHLDVEHVQGGREKWVSTLVISNPKAFTITSDFRSSSHRWCSSTM